VDGESIQGHAGDFRLLFMHVFVLRCAALGLIFDALSSPTLADMIIESVVDAHNA
jgi:hypothetical protein